MVDLGLFSRKLHFKNGMILLSLFLLFREYFAGKRWNILNEGFMVVSDEVFFYKKSP